MVFLEVVVDDFSILIIHASAWAWSKGRIHVLLKTVVRQGELNWQKKILRFEKLSSFLTSKEDAKVTPPT